jgi:aerobic-type carbon monoxide dehydrogenase small subunit (CoxS/CutS family)
MQKAFTLSVNGKSHTVTTDPERSLLEVLREELGLTGTKYGCGEGQCRACTVLLDDKPALACITSLQTAQGKSVLTIEGLAKGDELHPVQRAFLEEGAFQCGYCTPGMILETVALLKEHPKASDAEIVSGMQKHLCRCCNYPGVVGAIRRAGAQA